MQATCTGGVGEVFAISKYCETIYYAPLSDNYVMPLTLFLKKILVIFYSQIFMKSVSNSGEVRALEGSEIN